MKKSILRLKSFSICIVFAIFFMSTALKFSIGQPVSDHGQLSVVGNTLQDENNQPVILRGQSFGWSSWWPQYWNADVINWLTNDWKVDIVRAAMGIDPVPGYLSDPVGQTNLVKTVVDAAIANGIYVIIDWHSHDIQTNEAIQFFTEMAQTYGSYPNVIYEIFNEPDYETWDEVKNYSTQVINAIRTYDPDNIIMVGCPQWDQLIRTVADAPLTGFSNIIYTVHFYAASHGQWLRDECSYALGKNIPIYVSECSGMEASGSGAIDYSEWQAWFNFMDANNIGWCNYSISDKAGESCSVLLPGAPSNGGWTSSQLNESGNYIRDVLRSYASTTPPSQTPYLGSPVQLPGTVEAEDFDNGGEGVAFHDDDASNNGGAYRSSLAVDIENCSEGGYNVGWIANGEWLEYTVNVASSGTYQVDARVASSSAGGTLEMVFSNGNVSTGNLSFGATGGWQNWTTITANVNLNAGVQVLRLNMKSDGFNVNRIDITSVSSQVCEYYPVPLASDWSIRNSWNDQSLGSALTNTSEAMVFTHRSWGQEYAYLIFEGEQFNITQGDNYEISFDVMDADSKITDLEVGLCTGWQWDGPTGYLQNLITCDGGYSSSAYSSKSVSFTASSSGTAYVVIKVNLTRSSETPDFLFKNVDFCSDGNSLKSMQVITSLSTITNSNMKIYPNPVTTNQISIEFSENITEDYSVLISDVLGKIIYEKDYPASLGKVTISDIYAKPGIYMIQVVTPSVKYCEKLMIK